MKAEGRGLWGLHPLHGSPRKGRQPVMQFLELPPGATSDQCSSVAVQLGCRAGVMDREGVGFRHAERPNDRAPL